MPHQVGSAVKNELVEHLCSRRRMRHAQRASTARQPRGRIGASPFASVPLGYKIPRFPVMGEKESVHRFTEYVYGHYVDNQSRFTLFVKVQGKDTISVVTALSTQMRQLPSA